MKLPLNYLEIALKLPWHYHKIAVAGVAVSWDATLATSSPDTHGYVKQVGLVSLIPECLSGPSCKLVNLYVCIFTMYI